MMTLVADRSVPLRSFALAGLLGMLLVLVPWTAYADAPSPGDQVEITLHDGNTVVGKLIGFSETGYRISFSGTQAIVAYPSVKTIEVIQRSDPSERASPRTDTHPPDPDPAENEDDDADSEELDARPFVPNASSVPSSRDNEREGLTGRIPPKPESQGDALMITGFVMLGVGTAIGVASLASDEPDFDFGEEEVRAGLLVTGVVLASSGLVLSMTGIVLKTVSESRRRRWDRRYGALTSPSRGDVALVPIVGPDRAGGLAFVARF